MTQTKNTITISDRDRETIRVIAQLSDEEAFGVKCILAGISLGKESAKEKADRQQAVV